ncbi:MAG: DUF5916 domain-containing protein [Gemmatimonadales bacterium]
MAGTAGVATAQASKEENVIPLTRLSGPIDFDGMSDEPAWQDVEPFPMTVYAPTFNGPATEKTEIRVGYDDTYLYVAGRMYDSDPDGVRANTLYRDRYSGGDILSLVLDSYNDHETALWFSTSPAGVLSDRTVSNDAEFSGRNFANSDWNTFWDVKTARTKEGWFAEMRIPFSSIGFEDVNGHVEMGLIVYRLIARKSERHVFPAIPPNWRLAFAKPSQAQRVSLEGMHGKNPTYITPYVLGGLSRAAKLNTPATAYDFDHDRTNEAGFDIKYNPTSNLTLDVTANTDFAQVEADDQQVNLTRFSLFFPEKRQFFQERSSTFDFSTGGQDRLFHSRRIGLIGGQPIRIFGGARLVGRVGGTDIGVLNMQTDAASGLTPSDSGTPSENFGVFRIRQQVLNPFSTVGAIATTRAGDDGSYNVAVGLDGIVRPFGDEYITLKFVQTFDDSDPSGVGLVDRSLFLARWERRNDNGFSYSGDYIRSGNNYKPELGFIRRYDFTFLRNNLQYKRFQGNRSPFRSVSFRSDVQTYLRNGDRTVESGSIQPNLQFEFKSGAMINLSTKSSYESVLKPFRLAGGANVPAGDYWFHEGQLRVSSSRQRVFRPNMTVAAGSFYDGYRVRLQSGPAWSLSRHFELSANYALNVIRFNDRDVSLDTHLLIFRIQTALDVHLSLNTLMQYTSTGDLASINSRLRYHFSEGNDLWIVYDEGFNTDRDIVGQPRLPFSQNRAVMLKFTRTLIQ